MSRLRILIILISSVLCIRVEAQSAAPLAEDTLTIRIMGDIMMHTAQIADADKGNGIYDFSSYFKFIKDEISHADIAIANMEFTLSGPPHTGYPKFSAPDAFADYIASCGFDVFLSANNHIFDKGGAGAERTMSIYERLKDKYDIEVCGLYKNAEDHTSRIPSVIRKKGFSIALLNCTYGTNLGSELHWPKTVYMNERKVISSALAKAGKTDFTIVLPHWGPEYELAHSRQQRETAQWLIDMGADMIIGTHPHVIQDVETIDNVPVVYSIGNAVSNMSAANTQLGLMVTIRLVRDHAGETTALPLVFTWLWCSRPGGYCNSYCVIPVEKFIGSRKDWKGPWEYDKMICTFERVSKATCLTEKYL